jgi:soluble lytic murein transglycosylase
MDGIPLKNIAILALPLLVASAPLAAQEGAIDTTTTATAAWSAADWDRARANLVAQQPGQIAHAVQLWQQLSSSQNYRFDDYASFLLSYPGLPDAFKLQGYAEQRLSAEYVPADRLVAFFDRYEPSTNHARAQYALALMSQRPAAALETARAAWRGGQMSDTAAATLLGSYHQQFTQDDHDARMDALLWQRDGNAAARQLAYVSPGKRALFQARLAILQGGDGFTTEPTATADPGYLYNRSRELRLEGRPHEAVQLLANRPRLSAIPFDQTAWVEELLNVAKMTDATRAQRIAASVDDAFAPGDDISGKAYKLRDDYTSLMWLGGTKALWERGDGAGAAPLFYRYGAAARTPPTRSKGFFWAGHAAQRAGNQAEATRYYEMAAEYPDKFYGQLALERLGRPLPRLNGVPVGAPTAEERQAFLALPLTQAVTEVARGAPWSTGIRFYRAIADQADTLGEHLLVAELARNIGRRDLAVIVSDAAAADGHKGFTTIGHPTLVTPPGANWTMVHAISRQESQFADNAISHAGASGLMQLMPGTAREQAGKLGMAYMSASLINDPGYNIRLGDAYFQRMYNSYGSYPLAAAAYNAGPGNVNKWLRQNGDPRTGAISWIDWIERIPFFETKNYVQRVIENAVVYEALNPDKAPGGRPRGVSQFLR